MAYSKHIIKKQVIELEVEESLDSADIQDRVSRIYHDTVVPLLDKLLSNKSASSLLVIDHLEINIGDIPEDKLEGVLAEKIKTALQENLAAIKSSPSGNSHVEAGHNKQQTQSDHSDEALIIYFLQTGLFPWWAQENNYSFLEQKLHAVIKQNNIAFKTSFQNLLRDDAIKKRLAYNFNDALLETIAKQFFNISLLVIQPEKEMLISVFTDWYDLHELQAYWRMSFYKAMIAPGIHSEKKLFEKIEELFIVSVLQKSNIVSVLKSSSGNEQKKFSEKINRLNNNVLRETLKHYLQNKIDDDPGKQTTEGNNYSNKINDKTLAQKQHTMPVADLDKIYIQNAGLILLCPFLPRFFQNLGLADDRHFNDEAAAERACFILQYLVAGDNEHIFEAQLPLSKILCGISLLQPVDTQFAITESEKEIAEHFLFSIVQNGGAGWKNLSVDGLRKAYLKREGIISTRDGNWLLQVKRETYDILIDRLPWTVQIVRLPWMERLMFVEWQVV